MSRVDEPLKPRGFSHGLLTITIVGLPISYVTDICADVPRVIKNLLSDVSGWGKPFFRRAAQGYVIAWKVLWRALCGEGASAS